MLRGRTNGVGVFLARFVRDSYICEGVLFFVSRSSFFCVGKSKKSKSSTNAAVLTFLFWYVAATTELACLLSWEVHGDLRKIPFSVILPPPPLLCTASLRVHDGFNPPKLRAGEHFSVTFSATVSSSAAVVAHGELSYSLGLYPCRIVMALHTVRIKPGGFTTQADSPWLLSGKLVDQRVQGLIRGVRRP